MLYDGKPVDWSKGDFDDHEAQIRANEAKLKACDEAARAKGQKLGRIVRHGWADGYAIYQIVRVTPKTYTIAVCKGLGDDWVLPAWGERCTVSKKRLDAMLDHEDRLKALFAKARAQQQGVS